MSADRSHHAPADSGRQPGVATGPLPEVLGSIRQPPLNLTIWQRRLPKSIQQAMAALRVLMPRHRMFSLAPGAAADAALDEALHGFHGTAAAARDPWRSDLLGLLALARELAPQALLRVRIETKASNACQLFHVDHVALRLICTYRGQGTQWLPETAFDRGGLARGNNDHVRDWSALQEIPTGAVAVMKGDRFPSQPGRGLLHRSPPAGPDAPRILAIVDIDLV